MDYELNDILTVEDLMELLNIGKNTAYSLLESGEVKAFRIGLNIAHKMSTPGRRD